MANEHATSRGKWLTRAILALNGFNAALLLASEALFRSGIYRGTASEGMRALLDALDRVMLVAPAVLVVSLFLLLCGMLMRRLRHRVVLAASVAAAVPAAYYGAIAMVFAMMYG